MFGTSKPIEISKTSFVVRENKEKTNKKDEYKKPTFIGLKPEKNK